MWDLKNLIKQPKCNKNPNSPTCIDLISKNVPRGFQSAYVLETALFDFRLMTLAVIKKRIKKFKDRIIHYRSYKRFTNDLFGKCLFDKLSIVTMNSKRFMLLLWAHSISMPRAI